MVKKLVLGALLLTVVTTTLFAWVTKFSYIGNSTEQRFAEVAQALVPDSPKIYRTGKLPNEIIREIDNALQGYSLDVGDTFSTLAGYSGTNYMIVLRITDAKNCRWQFYALQEK
jgi:hypothetical protein